MSQTDCVTDMTRRHAVLRDAAYLFGMQINDHLNISQKSEVHIFGRDCITKVMCVPKAALALYFVKTNFSRQ